MTRGSQPTIPGERTAGCRVATQLFRTQVPARRREVAQPLQRPLEHQLGAPGTEAKDIHGQIAIGGVEHARRAQLQAAVELARRSLREELRSRDVLASPAAVRDFLALWLRDRGHEIFAGLFLDAQNRLISAEELFRGTLTQTAVYPREVARRALELNSAALILTHNHPSGVAEPSAADRMLTQALKTTLAQLDEPVLDHLIVAGNR